ncbi:MAG: hypothetical protein ACT4O9_03915, partial [Blastocatellia bacterium]
MRKHLLGFTIFLMIATVTSAVILLPRLLSIPDIPSVHGHNDPLYEEHNEVFDQSSIRYQIVASEFDADSGTFHSRVRLKWIGNSSPPEK